MGNNGDMLPFIGREKAIKDLLTRITEKKQHVAINGLPKIGKTRILKETERKLGILKQRNEDSGPLAKLVAIEGYPFPNTLLEICDELCDDDELPEAEAAGDRISDADAVERLRELLLRKAADRTLVLMVDELDRAFYGKNAWTEEQYSLFVRKLLLDQELNGRVLWVVASRQRLENLLKQRSFEQQLNPFVSVTIYSFNDIDIQKFFRALNDILTPRTMTDAEKKLVLKHCGRYPGLLALLASELKRQQARGNNADIEAAIRDSKTEFERHYSDVVTEMAREEETTMHSFSNLVRCYFCPTADDDELRSRFADLGYLEPYRLTGDPSKSPPFNALLDDGYPYDYMTVSPTFVYYLFQHCLERKAPSNGAPTIPGIQDPKVLLSGLIGILRRITRKELIARLGGDWNERLLLEHCVYCKQNAVYRFEISQTGIGLDRICEDDADRGRVRMTTKLSYFQQAMTNNSDTWSLDPINLTEHAGILRHFSDLFAPYFKTAFPNGLNAAFANRFSALREARNEYAHYLFSSRSVTAGIHAENAKKNCKELLLSIYTHITESAEYDQWL